MNCSTCKENYFMTEDTNSCYRRVIDNYYLDNITLKRCHSNCLDCYNIEDNTVFLIVLDFTLSWILAKIQDNVMESINLK